MVVAAVRRERVVVVAHRRAEAGGDRLLADAQVRRPPDEPLEEQLLGAGLEPPALDHEPVQAEAGLASGVGGGASAVAWSPVSTRWRRTAPATGTG